MFTKVYELMDLKENVLSTTESQNFRNAKGFFRRKYKGEYIIEEHRFTEGWQSIKVRVTL